ncbi:MAG: GTPase Era [Cyclobacteriaceae bacterium]|nr:MAG: GTPase Era [Cyclobacteriaceae bacterium]
MSSDSHKAGFVSIVGKPNAGKSTLMNTLIGERLSIITSKAQTTRHRIKGIISGEDFQIIYSDTPGIIQPKYELQENMMRFVQSSLIDADLILWIVELGEKMDSEIKLIRNISQAEIPVVLIINKIDLSKGTQLNDKLAYWREQVQDTSVKEIIPVSALHKTNIDQVMTVILEQLPLHPAYFPKDSLTDKPERFFAAEIIREKILENYKKEVPYSSEVVISEFHEEADIIRIRAEIYVERKSQKGILIGKQGAALKKVGTEARIEMEQFFQKKVYLEQFVKVEPDWRKKQGKLKRFGYSN